jgi:glycosyltransferase involved in cell wall biosynthesis
LKGATSAYDRDFGVELAWDVPLLEGYRWLATRNLAPHAAADRLFGLVNPQLWDVVRRGRFDVVVVYGYRALSFWIAALAGRISASAVMLAIDGHSLGSVTGNSWKVTLKRRLLPWLVRAFDGVLVPSTASATFMRDLGMPAERVFMAPYVVDNEFFWKRADCANRKDIRQSWGIPHDATVAIFSGKLVPWKRPADLLSAAARLDNVYVVYAGGGPLRAQLEHTATALGLMERVRFIGFINQTELPAVYRAADLLVLPSAQESFGLVVNEAFACGVPAIVSSACGSAGDLVRDGITGYVVEVADVQALASRVSTLAGQPALRKAMGERARARLNDWGPKQNAEAFAQACLTLAARSRTDSATPGEHRT